MSRSNNLFLTVLVTFGLIFGVLAHFYATGTSQGTTGGLAVEETFTLWDLDQTIATTHNEHGWFTDAMDGTGGITYLRAGMVGFLVAMVVAYSAWMLALIPATRGGSAPAVLAMLGGFGALAAITLHHLGLGLHTQSVYTESGYTMTNGLYAGILAGIVLVVGGIVGLTSGSSEPRSGRQRRQRAQKFDPLMQDLMCPDCGKIRSAAVGTVPSCSKCGFAAGLTPEMVG